MLGTCGGSDDSAHPIHPTLRYTGSGGGTPESSGACFTHLFNMHFRTSSCRHCSGVDLPLRPHRLDLYTTVGQGRRPHTQGWCQDQGAFLRTTRSQVFTPPFYFVPCLARSPGSCPASCGATSPIKDHVILGTTLETTVFPTRLLEATETVLDTFALPHGV